ncbi:DUF4469 domain-containing protein [Treponema sp. OMZ 840]
MAVRESERGRGERGNPARNGVSSLPLNDGTLTIGDDIIIEGNKLKIDETDAAQGVFFRLADGTEHKVTRRLSVNQPSQIIARVPAAVPAGKVTVVIRTKFAGSGKPLKEIREIVYKLTCTAKA